MKKDHTASSQRQSSVLNQNKKKQNIDGERRVACEEEVAARSGGQRRAITETRSLFMYPLHSSGRGGKPAERERRQRERERKGTEKEERPSTKVTKVADGGRHDR